MRLPNPYRRVRRLKPCGTRAAYERHIGRGEAIDEACRRAASLDKAERKDENARLRGARA